MIDAMEFTQNWLRDWNAHDLDAILSHYTDDFRMSTPYIPAIAGEPSGTLQGKERIRKYWEAGLRKFPDLHFELVNVFEGINAVAIYYKGPGGRLAVEVFRFNSDGLVYEAAAHYVSE